MSDVRSEKKNLVSFGFPEVKDVMKIPKEAVFAGTDVPVTIAMSARNRRIVAMANMEGHVKVTEVAKKLNISESTALVELRHLEALGFVKEVGHGERIFERRKKEVKVTEKKKGALDRWVNVV
jgi:predicted transcriptional regulator